MNDTAGRPGLRKMDRVLTQVRSSIDPSVPAQLVQTFIAVALDEGKSLTEYAQDIGAQKGTASRHLLDLGDRNRKMEPGYNLVDRAQHPTNLRTNVYTLTAKGKLLAKQIAEILED